MLELSLHTVIADGSSAFTLASPALSASTLAVRTRRTLVNAVAHLLLVRCLTMAKASSVFFRRLRDSEAMIGRRRPVARGLHRAERIWADPSALALDEEVRCRVGMQHSDRAGRKCPVGLTDRPVQAILLMPPLSVESFRRSITAIASGVLNAGFLKSS